MDKEILKVNLLAIAGSGLLIMLTGLGLYILRERVEIPLRYILPIPPLAVAAYIFVFNWFRGTQGSLLAQPWDVIGEVVKSAIFAGLVFAVFVGCLAVGIEILRK